MKAVQFVTDPEHILAQRDVFPAIPMPGADKPLPYDEVFSEGFLGFGVALTGSSCYMLSKMDPLSRRTFIESVYGENGLGLSVARLTVGSSDYSAELYSYDDTPFDVGLKEFSVSRDERYVIPIIREILDVKPDLYIFASPWSPPGWMKTGCNMCGGFMREKYVDVYADYFVRYIEEYAERGIKISAVTPQNEPRTDQYGKMPACVWHPETEAKFVRSLRRKLDEKGFDVKIWLYDHSFDGADRVEWQLDNIEGLEESLSGVAFHYYGGSIEQTLPLKAKYPELGFHFTEGGPRLNENYATDFCKWAIMMIKTLACGYKSFTGWNLMLDETGGPNIGPFSCGGLATLDGRNGELSYSGQYRAFAHLAPYVTKESKIFPVSFANHEKMYVYPKDRKPLTGIRIENGPSSVFVFVNPDDKKRQVCFSGRGKDWYVELVPDSVSTVVIEE